eukprot:4517722-Amphidinium_carterae.1
MGVSWYWMQSSLGQGRFKIKQPAREAAARATAFVMTLILQTHWARDFCFQLQSDPNTHSGHSRSD